MKLDTLASQPPCFSFHSLSIVTGSKVVSAFIRRSATPIVSNKLLRDMNNCWIINFSEWPLSYFRLNGIEDSL